METSYPRQDIKVLLLEGISASAVDSFHRAGYSNVELHSNGASPMLISSASARARN